MKAKEAISSATCKGPVLWIPTSTKTLKWPPLIASKDERKTLFCSRAWEVTKLQALVSSMILADWMLHWPELNMALWSLETPKFFQNMTFGTTSLTNTRTTGALLKDPTSSTSKLVALYSRNQLNTIQTKEISYSQKQLLAISKKLNKLSLTPQSHQAPTVSEMVRLSLFNWFPKLSPALEFDTRSELSKTES